MKRVLRIAYTLALLAGAGVCVFFGRRGVDADLFSLVGDSGPETALVRELNDKSASTVRVLCTNATLAADCRGLFAFESPIDVAAMGNLLRTKGKGLLSVKDRELLEKGEVDRIRRSVKRRDYSGVGIFPKTEDPYYFLHDFVMDLKALMPEGLPEGAEVLTGSTAEAANDGAALQRLIDFAATHEGVWLSGSPFHTYLATERTKAEVNVLSVVSLGAVLLLGFLLFRGFRFVGPTLGALGCGFLAGTAGVFLLPGRPHALTFLFGTTLIGLGVDYCYHALAERHDAAFRRNLTSALVTTCLAFVPLLLSSVSVLRQMAVFVIAGLVAIYGFVRLFFGAGQVQTPRALSYRPHGVCFTVVAALVALAAAAGIAKVRTSNDPASFYRPSPLMSAGEAKFAALFGTDQLKFKVLDLETWQRENAALKAKMGEEPAGDFLTAADLPRTLTLRLDGRDKLLMPASDGLDVAGALAEMFDRFARETYRLLALSLAVLLVALAALFRRRFLATVLPIAAAVAATVGALGWLGQPLSFFQALCFFILVGLGIDYVIFNQSDSADSGNSSVVLFSFLTSLVGFGMLGFTSFPVTRSMGITLALGLLFAYWFSLCRTVQSVGSVEQTESWGKQKEIGAGTIRIWAMYLTFLVFGKSFCRLVIFFIIVCVYPFAGAAKRAVRANFAQAKGSIRPVGPFRMMYNFACSMLDKLDACSSARHAPTFTIAGDAGWEKGGCFLLSTHVGCIEVLPAFSKTAGDSPFVHAFQQMGHDTIYTAFFVKRLDRGKLALHAVEDVGVETAVEMKEAIGRGEIVLMAGDRPPAGNSGRRSLLEAEFLGNRVKFPKGVFKFAKLMECPVFAMTCVRVGWNAYEIRARRLGENLLADYVAFLEAEVAAHPEQWFQFYDVFA